MEPPDDVPQRTQALVDKAYAHLDEEDYETALEVARQLEELRFTAAFEIAALAHEGMDDLEQAIRVLHRGTEAAPDCWPNWQLLGNFLSDTARYEEAEAAYEQALQCKGVWEACVRLNQAILAGRRGRNEKALELLDHVDAPELKLRVAEQWALTLQRMGRHEEAATLAERTLAENRGSETERDALARVAALLGRIWLEGDHDRREIRQLALGWLEIDPGCDELLALVRDLDGQYSSNARRFDLMLDAELPPQQRDRSGAVGFLVVCHVVADTPEEALEFARRLEPEELRPRLAIDGVKPSDPEPDSPKGVYWRSGRIYYSDED